MCSSPLLRRLLTGAVTVLVAASAVAAAPAHAQSAPFCQGGLGIALVDVPSETQDDPRARTYVVDHVQPGARLERRIRVCNGTSEALPVRLYGGAATIDDAAFTAVEGRVDNELSRWISVTPGEVTVPAGGEVLATAVIEVPQDATGGERYAAVLAERPAVQQSSGFAVAGRVGVRVYLSVGGPEEPVSDFVVESLQAGRDAGGRPVVRARVRNTGGRALDMRGELQLSEGPGGLSAGPFPATVGTTLRPGAAAPVEVVLDDVVRGGPWTATITMRSGLLERAARGTITFPEQAGAQSPEVEAVELSAAEDPRVLVPVAGSLILLIALLLLLLLWRRRRKGDDEEEHAAQEPVAAG